jgi:pyrroline-5-carboxylate reductase
MLEEKIGVVGAGKIGSAILRAMLEKGLAQAGQLMASTPRDENRRALEQQTGIKTVADNAEVCRFADIVILAVKPQVVKPVLERIAKALGKAKLLVSVAAGVPTSRIESLLDPGARVVRVMTNTPCVIGAAASAYAPGSRATKDDLGKVDEIFSSVGLALRVEEHHLDAVTGLGGSGPAYVFLFIDALADGGVLMGLSRDVALRLAVQTVYGSAKMALESGKHIGQLKDEVTSPGGTTLAGLHALESGGLRATVMEAVLRATRRSEELGRM